MDSLRSVFLCILGLLLYLVSPTLGSELLNWKIKISESEATLIGTNRSQRRVALSSVELKFLTEEDDTAKKLCQVLRYEGEGWCCYDVGGSDMGVSFFLEPKQKVFFVDSEIQFKFKIQTLPGSSSQDILEIINSCWNVETPIPESG